MESRRYPTEICPTPNGVTSARICLSPQGKHAPASLLTSDPQRHLLRLEDTTCSGGHRGGWCLRPRYTVCQGARPGWLEAAFRVGEGEALAPEASLPLPEHGPSDFVLGGSSPLRPVRRLCPFARSIRLIWGSSRSGGAPGAPVLAQASEDLGGCQAHRRPQTAPSPPGQHVAPV